MYKQSVLALVFFIIIKANDSILGFNSIVRWLKHILCQISALKQQILSEHASSITYNLETSPTLTLDHVSELPITNSFRSPEGKCMVSSTWRWARRWNEIIQNSIFLKYFLKGRILQFKRALFLHLNCIFLRSANDIYVVLLQNSVLIHFTIFPFVHRIKQAGLCKLDLFSLYDPPF